VCENTYTKVILNWYEVKGNSLVGEEPIENMTADDILGLFETPFWNKLYHCWAVNKSHIRTLQKNVPHKINTRKYSYFVEIYNVRDFDDSIN